MELAALIEALSDPAAYPHPVDVVEVRQTHISAVFLAGPYAYKVKKPLHLSFLDYSTLARRRHFCEREVALNRRLAPTVYLGVVLITRVGGSLKVDGLGEAIEWAVKMERLPEGATLRERLRREELSVAQVEAIADRIAEFHAQAESGPHVATSGRFDAVARNARENLDQSATHVGTAMSRTVFERLRRLTEAALDRLRPVIEVRAARGVPRDTHGDLRLGHVYLFPGRQSPDDLVVVDCIEFDDRYRHADPVADMAFLAMDFARHGRWDLGRDFAEAYFRASRDGEGRALLPFYAAYRAAVRGKVLGLKHGEREVPAAERAAGLVEARAHWLLALGELEDPGARPCLVLVGGLPGTGKSTLAHSLAGRADFALVRSDVVRKELAGRVGVRLSPARYGEGIYGPEWAQRTYAECARRAESLLFAGRRVLVDASFGKEAHRRDLLELACRWGVPAVLLLCRAEPSVVRARLGARRQDASDADWPIYLEAAARWEAPGSATRRSAWDVDSGRDAESATVRAIDVLRSLGLEG
jgi:aminoglycoside phosphotransferase family enzyme/predicted kinase